MGRECWQTLPSGVWALREADGSVLLQSPGRVPQAVRVSRADLATLLGGGEHPPGGSGSVTRERPIPPFSLSPP
jgi:hypothetical protein